MSHCHCGPFRLGKTTLISRLKRDIPQLKESISCTTRPMREGEQDGVHYHFVSLEKFTEKRQQGEFLEWAQVHSHYYGTEKKTVREGLAAGKALLFDLDIQGCDSIKQAFPRPR